MSLHKSLIINNTKRIRTVRKRTERLKKLIADGKVSIDNIKVYNLPKEKITKVKKVKPEKEEVKKDTLGSENA